MEGQVTLMDFGDRGKMKNGRFFLMIAAFVAVLFSSPAMAMKMVQVNGEMRPAYKEGEVIVKYKNNAFRDLRSMEEMYRRINVISVQRFNGATSQGLEQLTFNTEQNSVEQVVAELERDPAVEYAQPNYMIYAYPAKLAK